MRIAALGSGHVGRTLGLGFARHGHDVVMGSRNPQSEVVRNWLAEAGEGARAVGYAEAAAWCELALFVPTWTHAREVVAAVVPDNLEGKLVVDVTNPFGRLPDGSHGMVVPVANGAGAQLQRWLPGARVVKAWNSVGVESMVGPDFPEGPPVMPICGDDSAAKSTVSGFLCDFGWESVDFGGIEFSGYLEALAMLWVRYGRQTGVWSHAFKIIFRE